MTSDDLKEACLEFLKMSARHQFEIEFWQDHEGNIDHKDNFNNFDFNLKNNCADFSGYDELVEALLTEKTSLKKEKKILDEKLESKDTLRFLLDIKFK